MRAQYRTPDKEQGDKKGRQIFTDTYRNLRNPDAVILKLVWSATLSHVIILARARTSVSYDVSCTVCSEGIRAEIERVTATRKA